MTNTLFYGDNLHVLREHIADKSVDIPWVDASVFKKAKREDTTEQGNLL